MTTSNGFKAHAGSDVKWFCKAKLDTTPDDSGRVLSVGSLRVDVLVICDVFPDLPIEGIWRECQYTGHGK